SREETITGPPGVAAVPLTTTRHVWSAAPPSAFIGIVASSAFSAIETPPDELTPGGFHGSEIAIGAVKPGFRRATTFRAIDPPRTSGTRGSTTSIENGASSVTATARRSTPRPQYWTLF